MREIFLVPVITLVLLIGISFGREWTSSDGRKLQADFVSLEDGKVKMKRPNGQIITVPMDMLSEEDQTWAKAEAVAPKLEETLAPIGGPYAKLVTGKWELSEENDVKFAFHGSLSLNGDKTYPLVLALHGKSKNAENGKQLAGWMKSFTTAENQAERPCYVLAPMSAQPQAGEGRGWQGDEAGRVVKLIKNMIKELNVDPDRIYVVGHSMGGAGTCYIMAEDSRMFAAAIPVAGYSSSGGNGFFRKPIWIFHAENDDLVPVQRARDFAKSMKRNKKFKYTESATGGHSVVGPVFQDPETHVWLFDQTL